MGENGYKKEKIYYSMGEVAEMFDVNASLIRFWESKFDILKPHKNKKGNRMFTPEDVNNLKLIYHLVKEKGMTLAGAQKRIKNNPEGISRDMEVIERLLKIKSILLELRQELKMDGGEVYRDDNSEEEVFAPVSTKTLNTAAGDPSPKAGVLPHTYDRTIPYELLWDDVESVHNAESPDIEDGILPFDMADNVDGSDESKPSIIEQMLF